MANNITTINFDNNEYSLRPYGICSTTAATVAKTVDITGFTLFTGATILVKFTYTNTAVNPTLNINSTGAKSIKHGNEDVSLIAGVIYEFIYDGTNWEMVGLDHVDINNKIDALAAGLKLTVTANPTIIRKNTTTNVTFEASVTDDAGAVTPTSVKINDEVVSKDSNNKYKKTISINTASNTHSISASATANGMELKGKVTINVRNLIYYGMSADVNGPTSSNLSSFENTLRTSSRGATYTDTATANSSYFYLIVPSDVTSPTSDTSFTMGGAPATFTKTTATINSISYNIYKSNASYNAGISVSITAN